MVCWEPRREVRRGVSAMSTGDGGVAVVWRLEKSIKMGLKLVEAHCSLLLNNRNINTTTD